MSEIPGIIASSLQSLLQQRQASQSHQADESRTAELRQQRAAIDERAHDVVETTDDDTRIHPEAGQGGGQGRPFSGKSSEQEETPPDEDSGITVDEDGRLHLDLEA